MDKEVSMKHFLSLADLSPQEMEHLLDLAIELKEEWKRGGNRPLLRGKTLGMIFQKPSLRTRVSFDMAMLHLGGHALYLSPNEIQLGVRESIPDVARVLSRYVDAIMARVFAHSDLLTLAEYSRVPVINGLSDYSHPCQGLADFLTIIEKKGRDLRGKKLAFVGDGNNVATSLLFGATKLGMDFAIATPPGYELPTRVWELGRKFAMESGSHILATHDPAEAVREADVIYTDVWTSMGQEAEAAQRAKVFPPYQVNAALVAQAKPDVIVMHCLPAHRGQEITDDVADGPHSVLWDQAENRMHAQKAILVELMVGT
ncbi:MAG: ornithine carbamoyltransferase [Anaerolineae bacterium]|nr:ornithine carbamoyltransferase [Anaerolineae bacterium]MDW8068950.1 ornithine carbamoyltransferase [Anaerolineae bacterium]